MKKFAVLAIVVVLLLGLLLPTSLMAQGPPNQPQQPAPQGTSLLTIAENLPLEPGERFDSEWLDVKSFRLFKLYARLTPYEGETPWEGETQPPVRVRILDSPLGNVDEGSYGSAPANYEWMASPSKAPMRWVIASSFDGLYSKMKVFAKNDGDTPVTISLYLLMAEE